MKIANWEKLGGGLAGMTMSVGGTACSLSYMFNSASSPSSLLLLGIVANIGVLAWSTVLALRNISWSNSNSSPSP